MVAKYIVFVTVTQHFIVISLCIGTHMYNFKGNWHKSEKNISSKQKMIIDVKEEMLLPSEK